VIVNVFSAFSVFYVLRAVVRALCAFLPCSRVHFIFAYCTVFNEGINDDNDEVSAVFNFN